MKFNRFAHSPILFVIIAFLLVLSMWFFFWPIVEMVYAWSWEPLLSGGIVKESLFFIGGFIFFITVWMTGKILI